MVRAHPQRQAGSASWTLSHRAFYVLIFFWNLGSCSLGLLPDHCYPLALLKLITDLILLLSDLIISLQLCIKANSSAGIVLWDEQPTKRCQSTSSQCSSECLNAVGRMYILQFCNQNDSSPSYQSSHLPFSAPPLLKYLLMVLVACKWNCIYQRWLVSYQLHNIVERLKIWNSKIWNLDVY